jgi:hypothetical protein
MTTLFAVRVFGQALVAFFGVTWLPPMRRWSSGVIAYPALLIVQLLMLLLMINFTKDIWRASGRFAIVHPHWSKFLKQLSAVYDGVMISRYILTMTLRPEMRWSGDVIPIIFHFVLAGFIFILGDYHQVTTDT